ncbi:MAG: PepSY domain-containing protein [Puia sp.]|nr:PepSY domain-containing protein [Puia sp.]
MLKKNIYQWHRRLSLLIAIPLLLSAASGFMHPIMTNIRPSVATQGLRPVVVDSSQLLLSLQAALDSNHIDSISQFRIVHIDTNWFYQVQREEKDVPVYLSTRTGRILSKGDWIYAQWLARQFLEGPGQNRIHSASSGRETNPGSSDVEGSKEQAGVSTAMQTGASMKMHPGMPMVMNGEASPEIHDCCGTATSSVLNAPGSKVLNAIRLTRFDEEYNAINRLLPVYKVSFERPDGIRVYVETVQDRFSFAVDNRRAGFNRLFQYIHTYQWLDFLGQGKQVAMFLLMATAFLTTVLGIYIFFSTRSKKVPGKGYTRARRNHRYTAVVISLFTLMFSFSGGYHALYKLKEDTRDRYFVKNRFAARDMRFDYHALAVAAHGPLIAISVARIETGRYWRVTTPEKPGSSFGKPGNSFGKTDSSSGKRNSALEKTDSFSGKRGGSSGNTDNSSGSKTAGRDLMRDRRVPSPVVTFVNATDGSVLEEGERRYADWLATGFSGYPATDIISTKQITKFDGDYNFTNKRLPVWQVAYPQNSHECYYVETATGSLSARVNDRDKLEGYSFAFLHKHEFLGGIGKWAKDASTMFWAAAQIFMVALGLFLYFRWVRKRQRGS